MGSGNDNGSQAPGDARRFAAFISYSHVDADAAAKLQRKLERYRLPRHIAETRASDAAALGPIFRDREDLAAAASLSAAIRDAIARAEALVVMCSPDAAKSPWVAAEIELFRELHPDGPILAALLSGEPATAFPPALTAGGNEPLAADLRPEGDGEQLAFLKIVAGIAGVPLDALIQRDAQRRLRRVTTITAGAIAAVLAMSIMTAYAIQARNEAARQRAAAEGLVEYMLTDLREKLKGVGRLDVMGAVNERAKAYYGRGSVKGRLLDAQVLHAMGEDFAKQGQLEKADKSFQEAHAETAALLKANPANADAVFGHAQSEYWVGFAAWRKADIATAGRYWREYLKQAKALARIEPRSIRTMMELGYAHGNMCEFLMNKQQDVQGGIAHCKKSIDFQRSAVAANPKDTANLMALANRLGWMADALVSTKDYQSAIEYRKSEQRIVDSLVATDPKNVEYLVRQTWPQIGLGKIAESQGKTNTAVRHLSVALQQLDKLTTQFSDDFSVLEYRIRTNIIIARALRSADRPAWRGYRDQAARLIATTTISNTEGLPRMSAMLARFDGEK